LTLQTTQNEMLSKSTQPTVGKKISFTTNYYDSTMKSVGKIIRDNTNTWAVFVLSGYAAGLVIEIQKTLIK
jgi:hypothetical protein